VGIEHDGGVEPRVLETVGKYRSFISERPLLLSLLYDINMLPEQTVTLQGAIRLAAFCEVWKKGEEGALSGLVKVPLNVDGLAQEIRRVDGNNSLGAGALAEAIMPYIQSKAAPLKDAS
jgi:hypothetical protein